MQIAGALWGADRRCTVTAEAAVAARVQWLDAQAAGPAAGDQVSSAAGYAKSSVVYLRFLMCQLRDNVRTAGNVCMLMPTECKLC